MEVLKEMWYLNVICHISSIFSFWIIFTVDQVFKSTHPVLTVKMPSTLNYFPLPI